ncbi:MAG TPA: ABC transporter permease subunit [Stellaceae bacterium]|nr:ABC transporter permease subunit [Stellaceae bacterium]
MVRRPSPRAYAGQWLLLLAAAAVAWYIVSNAGDNLARRNMSFGFGFLWDVSNFDIPFRLVPWSEADTYGRALLVSFLNTIAVAACGIVAATLLGLFIGIMRLSANWLVRNIALSFVEFIRNTPQLIQIVFWYFAVLQTLPSPRQSIVLPAGMLLNIRGAYLPNAVMTPHGGLLSGLALLALAATPFLWRVRVGARRVGANALFLPVLALALFAAGVDHIDWPTLKGFNIRGGTQVPPEFVALWLGLSIYAAAFIAEIVRGSIEAISKGQSEAAQALGLKTGQRLFLIILPQALRIMVPQLTSQYLNIIKSSTLGAVVAYPEVMQIFAGTVMNQAGKEIETIIIVMAIFLAINLLTSAFMNWYNRRVALVER